MLVRRGVDLAQVVFRALVDAVSNPGRPVRLPTGPDGLHPVVLPVLTVVDLQTAVAVVGPNETGPAELGSAIGRVTGAPTGSDHRAADVVLVTAPSSFTADLVWTLRTGSSMAPEQGAKVFVACEAIIGSDDGSDALDLRVTGPGSTAGRNLRILGIDPQAVAVIDRVNAGYPAGIDVFMVDPGGLIVGLPRSNRVRVGGDR
jgi:alpha-D-ribose 1-methylphosphonate 5-triphosphate synthase subunit PhnH